MPTDEKVRMARLLEDKVRDIFLDDQPFDDVKVAYAGEPQQVPTTLYPLQIIVHLDEREADGEDGYDRTTGYVYTRHEMYCSVEVLYRATDGLAPDQNRKADVPSHREAQRYAGLMKVSLEAWSPETDPVLGDDYATDGERTVGRVHVDRTEDQIQQRTDAAENRGNVYFHLYSRVNDY